MMRNPDQLLRTLNPEPSGSAPPIDGLWRRLEARGLVEADEGAGAVGPLTDLGDSRQRARLRHARHGSGWASRLVVAGLVGVAVAMGVGAVVVLHPSHRPVAGASSVASALPSPSRGLVGILGVLRRPQTQADRELGPALASSFRRIEAGVPVSSLIRVAGVTHGQKIVLVPMRSRPGHAWPPGPRGSGSTPGSSGLRLALFAGGAGCCSTPAQIESGQAWSSYGNSSGNYVALVVPDSVARVRVAFSRPITAPVHGNVAVFSVPQAVENLSIYKMTWYAASGAIVNRFKSTLPTTGQSARTRARLIRHDQQSTAQIAPQIAAHFPLFMTSPATGVLGSGSGSFRVSAPSLASLPTSVLSMGTGSGLPMVVRATREVTTSSGLRVWIQAGRVICINGTPTERVGACSGSPALALASGLIVFPQLPNGHRIILGVVPNTNPTITLHATAGATKTVPVTDGIFITPASSVTQIQVKSTTGKTTTAPVPPAITSSR